MFEKIGYEKVADNALKYSYDSPTAFNRAFQNIHGIASSVVKKEGPQAFLLVTGIVSFCNLIIIYNTICLGQMQDLIHFDS